MKIKLNFKADAPTVNGHIYPKEVLKKAFDERFKTDVFISSESSPYLKVENIIAKAESYEITPDSEILIDVKMIDTPAAKIFKDEKFEITTSGIGVFENDHKTISDQFKLSHFFVVKEESELKDETEG